MAAINTQTKPTLFQSLVTLGNDNKTVNNPELAQSIDDAIFLTKQGKACREFIAQYNSGLITFAEFNSAFVFHSFRAD